MVPNPPRKLHSHGEFIKILMSRSQPRLNHNLCGEKKKWGKGPRHEYFFKAPQVIAICRQGWELLSQKFLCCFPQDIRCSFSVLLSSFIWLVARFSNPSESCRRERALYWDIVLSSDTFSSSRDLIEKWPINRDGRGLYNHKLGHETFGSWSQAFTWTFYFLG